MQLSQFESGESDFWIKAISETMGKQYTTLDDALYDFSKAVLKGKHKLYEIAEEFDSVFSYIIELQIMVNPAVNNHPSEWNVIDAEKFIYRGKKHDTAKQQINYIVGTLEEYVAKRSNQSEVTANTSAGTNVGTAGKTTGPIIMSAIVKGKQVQQYLAEWKRMFNWYAGCLAKSPTGELPPELAKWVDVQNILHFAGQLSEEQDRQIEAIGHKWVKKENEELPFNTTNNKATADDDNNKKETKIFSVNYFECREFKNTNKRDPFITSENPKEAKLGKWLNEKKRNYNNLSIEQQKALKKLVGDNLDFIDELWLTFFERFKNFCTKDTSHRRPLEDSKEPDEAELGKWGNAQLGARKNNMLIDEKAYLIESIPDVVEENIIKYDKKINKHSGVAVKLSEEEISKRKNVTTKLLDIEKVTRDRDLAQSTNQEMPEVYKQLLSQLTDSTAAIWKEGFEEYYLYKRSHSWQDPPHYSVYYTQTSPMDSWTRKIAHWLKIQRQSIFSDNKTRTIKRITPYEIVLLESVPGYSWSTHLDMFYEKLRGYELYKRTYGIDPLRSDYKVFLQLTSLRRAFWHRELSLWQIYLSQEIPDHSWGTGPKGETPQEIIDALVKKAGFSSWADVQEDFKNFILYVEFKQQNMGDPTDKELAEWLKKKRRSFMNGDMTLEEIDRFHRFVKGHKWIVDKN
jgi:hypothetical protein